MEALWALGPTSIREIHAAFPGRKRPAYTTVQTMVYRLEAKGVVQRLDKVGNAHIFAATISRGMAQRRLIDELLGLLGGRSQPLLAHLIDSGDLTLEDIKEAERVLREKSRS